MWPEKIHGQADAGNRDQLEHIVRAGKNSAGVTIRILLKTGEWRFASRVVQTSGVAEGTVFHIKRRFAEDGLDRALAHRYRKL